MQLFFHNLYHGKVIICKYCILFEHPTVLPQVARVVRTWTRLQKSKGYTYGTSTASTHLGFLWLTHTITWRLLICSEKTVVVPRYYEEMTKSNTHFLYASVAPTLQTWTVETCNVMAFVERSDVAGWTKRDFSLKTHSASSRVSQISRNNSVQGEDR